MSNSMHAQARRFLRAAYDGNKETVLQLLDDGVPIDSTHHSGLQALHFAAKNGHVEIAAELLNRGALINSTSLKGSTPLHIAALLGKTDMVKLLLKHGADINMMSSHNEDSFTSLYMAAQIGHQEIVTLLLAYGADPSVKTKNGSCARSVALQQGHHVVAQILAEYEARYSRRKQGKDFLKQQDIVRHKQQLDKEDKNNKDKDKSDKEDINVKQNGQNGIGDEELEKLGKAMGRDCQIEGSGATSEKLEKQYGCAKDIIMNKIRATLPPVYSEAIPSPLNSPRRAPRRSASGGISDST